MKDKVEKALEIRRCNHIERNPETACYFVPSQSEPGREYMVSASGHCNCNSVVICSHSISAYGAHVPVLQFRWADDIETLLLVAEVHKATISKMPERLRVFCRQEFSTAKHRLQGEQQKAA